MEVFIYRRRLTLPETTASSKLAKSLGASSFCASNYPPPLENKGTVVNWGYSAIPNWSAVGYKWINKPNAVALSANKIRMFDLFTMHNIPTYEYYLNKGDLPENTHIIVRKLIDSHSGNGIEFINTRELIPNAELYTKYQYHEKEVRVFVVNGQVIYHTEKKRINDNAHPIIKSLRHGWYYEEEDKIRITSAISEVAIFAVKSIGLDFGAVDIGFNSPYEPVVIETNSSPGLRSITVLKKLSDAIRGMIK